MQFGVIVQRLLWFIAVLAIVLALCTCAGWPTRTRAGERTPPAKSATTAPTAR